MGNIDQKIQLDQKTFNAYLFALASPGNILIEHSFFFFDTHIVFLIFFPIYKWYVITSFWHFIPTKQIKPPLCDIS
jgi:hypothetical protein